MDDRLHLRLPKELKVRIQDYAKRRRTTVTALVIRFFTALLREEESERQKSLDAEQI